MSGKTGVLLVNLGTPDGTSYWPMRKYLKEFLSDPRVVEARGLIWWLIFNGIILTKRPKLSGRAYAKIWNYDLDESPLKTITRSQAEKVAEHYSNDETILVDWAMRYGNPSIASKINDLMAKGCESLLVFPLYPQYSAATTASVMDKVFDSLKTLRFQPSIQSVPPYYSNTEYIKAIATSIRDHHDSLDWKPEVTIASLHGLPQSFIDKGDPYQQHCENTVQLLRNELGMTSEELVLTYQSRSGRAIWLSPDTEDTLISLAQRGVQNVTVVTPGFASDCIETLEEIKLRAAEIFHAVGGLNFSHVPCMNDSAASINLMTKLIDGCCQAIANEERSIRT